MFKKGGIVCIHFNHHREYGIIKDSVIKDGIIFISRFRNDHQYTEDMDNLHRLEQHLVTSALSLHRCEVDLMPIARPSIEHLAYLALLGNARDELIPLMSNKALLKKFISAFSNPSGEIHDKVRRRLLELESKKKAKRVVRKKTKRV